MSLNFDLLTLKQKKVYLTIEAYIKANGIPPTVREIGDMLGEKTPGAIQGILNRLEQKGIIRRQTGMARSIQLVSDTSDYEPHHYIPEIKKINRRNLDELLSLYNISRHHPVSTQMLSCPDGCFIYKYDDYNKDTTGFDTFVIVSRALAPKHYSILLVMHQNYVLIGKLLPDNTFHALNTMSDTLFGRQTFNMNEVDLIGEVVGQFIKYR